MRRLLFDAVASGDERRLEHLCREHKDLILAHRDGWLKVPDSFRATPEVYAWYGDGLRAIAEFCAGKSDESFEASSAEPSNQTH